MRVKKRNAKRGGSLFPKRRDPAYMRWCLDQLDRGVVCDMCGQRRANARAHVDPKGNGGFDAGGILLLCDGPGDTCHRKQEKRTDAVSKEIGKNLRAIAWLRWVAYVALRNSTL